MQKIKLTKLSSQGQLTLTKEVLKTLEVLPGNLLEMYVDNKLNEVILRKPTNKTKKYIGILKGKVNLNVEEYLKERKKEAYL